MPKVPILQRSLSGSLSVWLFRRHLTLQSLHKPGFYVWRNLFYLGASKNLESLFSGVYDHKAVRALIYVPLPVCFHLLGNRLIQVVVQFPEELFTGKQMRLPLSA